MDPYLRHHRVSAESYCSEITEGGGSIGAPPKASIWMHSGLLHLLAYSLHVSVRWYFTVREDTLFVFRVTNTHHVQLSRFVGGLWQRFLLIIRSKIAYRNPNCYRLLPTRRSFLMIDDNPVGCRFLNVWSPGTSHGAHDGSGAVGILFANWWGITLMKVCGEVIVPMGLLLPGAFGEQKERRYKQFIF